MKYKYTIYSYGEVFMVMGDHMGTSDEDLYIYKMSDTDPKSSGMKIQAIFKDWQAVVVHEIENKDEE